MMNKNKLTPSTSHAFLCIYLNFIGLTISQYWRQHGAPHYPVGRVRIGDTVILCHLTWTQ